MEPAPVRQSRTPTYPTRREVLAGAATFTLASLAGCWPAWADSEKASAIVAPIFEHGEGRGATGCVVVLPPVFLSEEEAMQIIREELAGQGIQLKGGVILESVRIPQRMRKSGFEKTATKDAEGGVFESKKHAKPLKLDGVDAEKKVAVEFVSKQRYFDVGGVQESYSSDELDDPDAAADNPGGPGHWFVSSSAQSYDFKGTAEFVATHVKKQGKEPIYLGVFYDPQWETRRTTARKNDLAELGDALEILKKLQEQRKDDSKKLLRLQAQDFVAWLKKNKAIK